MLDAIGRLHVVLLHLPIGLLIGVAALELGRQLRPRASWDQACAVLLPLLAFSALFSALAGWLLARGGDYGGDTLFWHRWLGVGLAALCCALWIVHLLRGVLARTYRIAQPLLTLVGVVLLIFVGHQGGTLTHGRGFLWPDRDRAPPATTADSTDTASEREAPPADTGQQRVSSDAAEADGMAGNARIDFADQVLPLLRQRCMKCHGPDKRKGGLRLDSAAALRAGGDDGAVVVAGHPELSSLYLLVALPREHEDRMPAKGDPLSPAQQDLLRRWIAAGADFGTDGPAAASADEHAAAQALPPSEIDRLGASLVALPEQSLSALRASGLYVAPLDLHGRCLDIGADRSAAGWNSDEVAALRAVAPHVVWLDASRSELGALTPLLGDFVNLRRLQLKDSDADDASLTRLVDLPALEALNLVGTRVTDAGLQHVVGLDSLRELHLWNSGVSQAGVQRLRRALPDCTITFE